MPGYYDDQTPDRLRSLIVQNALRVYKLDRVNAPDSIFENDLEILVRKVAALVGYDRVRKWVADVEAGLGSAAERAAKAEPTLKIYVREDQPPGDNDKP